MSSRTPDLRESLWIQKSTYRAFRRDIGEILGDSEQTPVLESPAVRHLTDSIQTFRLEVAENHDPADLKRQLTEDPSFKIAEIPVNAHVLVMLHGGKETTTIKYFNDELVGPEITNAILDKRNELIERTLHYFGMIEEGDSLSNNHKTNHFAITPEGFRKAAKKMEGTLTADYFAGTSSGGGIGSPFFLRIMEYIVRLIERDFQKATKEILQKYNRELRKDGDVSAQADRIEHWIETELGQLTLHFGISDAIDTAHGSEQGLSDRLWADQQAEWSARNAHVWHQHTDKPDPARGKSFDLFHQMSELDLARTQILQDPALEPFFETIEENERSYRVLKLGVITHLRKWSKFKAEHADDPDLVKKYEKLRVYYQSINCIDYILPFTDTNDAWQAIKTYETLARSTNTDADDLRDVLKHDPRDNRDLTANCFHCEAIEHPMAYYISFDAVGIGNLNVRDLELVAINAVQMFQESKARLPAAQLKDNLRAMLMAVGRRVTVALRDKFESARQAFETRLVGQAFFSTRGGDEWHVVFPVGSTDIDENVLFEAIVAASSETDLRATACKKDSRGVYDDDRIHDHYLALDRNERNNAAIKEFEKVGLHGFIAVPVQDNQTGVLIPYRDRLILVDKILVISEIIAALREQGIPITLDGVVSSVITMSRRN